MADQFVLASEDGWAIGVYPHELAAWIAAGADARRVREESDSPDTPCKWVIEKFDGTPEITELHVSQPRGNPNGLANYVITQLKDEPDASS